MEWGSRGLGTGHDRRGNHEAGGHVREGGRGAFVARLLPLPNDLLQGNWGSLGVRSEGTPILGLEGGEVPGSVAEDSDNHPRREGGNPHNYLAHRREGPRNQTYYNLSSQGLLVLRVAVGVLYCGCSYTHRLRRSCTTEMECCIPQTL